jgi:predicted dehydrogenase
MSDNTIGVGIVGGSLGAGWANRAHVPALRALGDRYRITAVSTTKEESARAAAREWGVPHHFADAAELAAHPDVDLVVVTVKVPAHDVLVRAAVEAGKHVYCEWPLARNTEEATRLRDLAADADVRHAVGLQARFAPPIRRARELIAEGYVGEVDSVTVNSSLAKGVGGRTPVHNAYTYDSSSGAGILEVAGGHTLDALEFILGELSEISARTAVRHGDVVVNETGRHLVVTSPDHFQAHARFASGALASVHLAAAKASRPRVRIEISGSRGDLAIESIAGELSGYGVQISPLRLRGTDRVGGDWRILSTSEGEGLPGQALHVAEFYRRLAEHIDGGHPDIPDFAAAVRTHRVLDAARASAASGTTRPI